MSPKNLKEAVKGKHGHAAPHASKGGASLRRTALTAQECPDLVSPGRYDGGPVNQIPLAAPLASLRCGSPSLRDLKPGDVVLNLGSEGEVDLEFVAEEIETTAPALNSVELIIINCVEFLKGVTQSIPLPPNSVDIIVSDCVINLCPNKDRVFREAFRILKPGGRFAVSDMLTRAAVPAGLRRRMEQWIRCMASAVEESEYVESLARVEFEGVSIQPSHVYRVEDARGLLASKGIDVDAIAPWVDGKFTSSLIRANKPRA